MSSVRGPAAAAGMLAAFLIATWGIFLFRGELSWRRAEALAAEGESAAAASAARGVFDLHVPGSPRLGDASELIWDSARVLEAAGEREAALARYRTLRSAWIGASPLGGDRGWIGRTEARIARLTAGDGRPGQAAVAAMGAPRRPHGPWGGLAALGFAAWVLAAVGLIARGVGADGRPRTAALAWAGVLAAGYAVWILGLLRA